MIFLFLGGLITGTGIGMLVVCLCIAGRDDQ